MNSANPTSFLIEQRIRGQTVPANRPCKGEMESLLVIILKQYFDWIGTNLLTANASVGEKEEISFIQKRIQVLTANVSNTFSGFGIIKNHGAHQSVPSEIESLWNDQDFKIARNACAVQIDELNAIAVIAQDAFEGFPSSRQSSQAAMAKCTFQQVGKDLEKLEWLDAYLAQAAAASTVLRTWNAREERSPRELSLYFLEPLEPLNQD